MYLLELHLAIELIQLTSVIYSFLYMKTDIQICCFLYQLSINHLPWAHNMIQRLQKHVKWRENLSEQPRPCFYLLISLHPAGFHKQFQVAYNKMSFLIRAKQWVQEGRRKVGKERRWGCISRIFGWAKVLWSELADFTAHQEGQLVDQSKNSLCVDLFS